MTDKPQSNRYQEVLDRAYMHLMTVESSDSSPEEKMRAALFWVAEVTSLMPKRVGFSLAGAVLKNIPEPVLGDDGKPLIYRLMHLTMRKCRVICEEQTIEDEMEPLIREMIRKQAERHNEGTDPWESDGEEWKNG